MGWDLDPVDVLSSLVFLFLSMLHHGLDPMNAYIAVIKATPERDNAFHIPDDLPVIPYVSRVVRVTGGRCRRSLWVWLLRAYRMSKPMCMCRKTRTSVP